MADGTKRADVKPGALVDIVLKADQPTGKLTRGRVARLLTHSPNHPHGIKVMLDDGKVGRVAHILEESRDCR
ncbi:MAG: YwbE family protein [Oscillospiraceae bacterium]